MRTFTKLALAAAGGYALRAYINRPTIENSEALKHSVDRRLSVEGTPTIAERVVYRLVDKGMNALLSDQSRRHVPYRRDYSRPSRYQRFYGRKNN